MSTKPIDVKIIDSSPDSVTVKLPFLEVPIQMNHELFNKRMKSGYFQVTGHYAQGSNRAES